jgi:hypothetical protein
MPAPAMAPTTAPAITRGGVPEPAVPLPAAPVPAGEVEDEVGEETEVGDDVALDLVVDDGPSHDDMHQ